MEKIIGCIDGSAYADAVCQLSAWASERTQMPVALLHVVAPHSDHKASGDLTGAIGLGANTELLEKLTQIDEQRGKLEQQKGKLMLDYAAAHLVNRGLPEPEILHRRGSVVETLVELEAKAGLIIMGLRGEDAKQAPNHLGSNVARVARAIHKPILATPLQTKPIQRFLLAYDGGESSRKALDYIASQPLLRGLECHVLKVGEPSAEAGKYLDEAKDRLQQVGIHAQVSLLPGHVSEVVKQYVQDHAIDLLVMGAYGHTKIRTMIIGSTTTTVIRTSDVPVLLFR